MKKLFLKYAANTGTVEVGAELRKLVLPKKGTKKRAKRKSKF